MLFLIHLFSGFCLHHLSSPRAHVLLSSSLADEARKGCKQSHRKHRTGKKKATVPPSNWIPRSPTSRSLLKTPAFAASPLALKSPPPSLSRPRNPLPRSRFPPFDLSLPLWIGGSGARTPRPRPPGSRSDSTASWSLAPSPASGTPGLATPDPPDLPPSPASRPRPPPLPGRRHPPLLRSKGSSLALRLGPAARGSSSGRSSPPPSPSSTPPRARISPIPSWTPSAWIWSPRTELGRTLLGFWLCADLCNLSPPIVWFWLPLGSTDRDLITPRV